MLQVLNKMCLVANPGQKSSPIASVLINPAPGLFKSEVVRDMIKKKGNRKTSPKGAPYEAPAIIYEGLLSTRAGTFLPGSQNPDGVDPADLFGKK
jgi:hypothetical protein